jgi:hypothetical protein
VLFVVCCVLFTVYCMSQLVCYLLINQVDVLLNININFTNSKQKYNFRAENQKGF